jgi:hypothetical protein
MPEGASYGQEGAFWDQEASRWGRATRIRRLHFARPPAASGDPLLAPYSSTFGLGALLRRG